MLPIVLILPILLLSTFGYSDAQSILPFVSMFIPITVFAGNLKMIHTLNYMYEGAVWFGPYSSLTGVLGLTSALELYKIEYMMISGIVGFSSALILAGSLFCQYMGVSEKMQKMFGDENE